jgi:hypothetical protein
MTEVTVRVPATADGRFARFGMRQDCALNWVRPMAYPEDWRG